MYFRRSHNLQPSRAHPKQFVPKDTLSSEVDQEAIENGYLQQTKKVSKTVKPQRKRNSRYLVSKQLHLGGMYDYIYDSKTSAQHIGLSTSNQETQTQGFLSSDGRRYPFLEHGANNAGVAGSSPAGSTKIFFFAMSVAGGGPRPSQYAILTGPHRGLKYHTVGPCHAVELALFIIFGAAQCFLVILGLSFFTKKRRRGTNEINLSHRTRVTFLLAVTWEPKNSSSFCFRFQGLEVTGQGCQTRVRKVKIFSHVDRLPTTYYTRAPLEEGRYRIRVQWKCPTFRILVSALYNVDIRTFFDLSEMDLRPMHLSNFTVKAYVFCERSSQYRNASITKSRFVQIEKCKCFLCRIISQSTKKASSLLCSMDRMKEAYGSTGLLPSEN